MCWAAAEATTLLGGSTVNVNVWAAAAVMVNWLDAVFADPEAAVNV